MARHWRSVSREAYGKMTGDHSLCGGLKTKLQTDGGESIGGEREGTCKGGVRDRVESRRGATGGPGKFMRTEKVAH